MEGLESINNLGPENTERPRYHFFYFNKDISDHPVIFDCPAGSRSEADLLYEEKMGKSSKGDHISCSTVRI